MTNMLGKVKIFIEVKKTVYTINYLVNSPFHKLYHPLFSIIKSITEIILTLSIDKIF